MNHQPFRQWLLSEEELPAEQAQALQNHLRDCESCSRIETSWKELEAIISRAQQFDPAPGFAARWQIRLIERQHHQQQLRGWYTIGATALISAVLFIFLATQIWNLIQAPGAYLAGLFDRVIVILSILFTFSDFVRSISLPGPLYTLLATTLLFGMISFISVFWLATYRRIILTRREA